MADITPGEVADLTCTIVLIYVRELDEYRAGHI
jgi:hypothetical protein